MNPLRCLASAGVVVLCASLAGADITNITQGTTHLTIQEAISSATHGDEIVVDPGTYHEAYINLEGKAVTLRSQDPSDPGVVARTIINGGSFIVMFAILGEGPDTIVSGFVMTGSDADFCGGLLIEASSPTIRRCVFQDNSAMYEGGGMYLYESNSLIEDCAFVGNYAPRGGGLGIFGGSPTIRHCSFDRNDAFDGGAIWFNGTTATVEDCVLRANRAEVGGGVFIRECAPEIRGSRVVGNIAYQSGGGAMVVDNAGLTLSDSALVANSAADDGGGIALKIASSATITRSTFHDNEATTGGGLFILDGCSASVTDSVMERNVTPFSGGGIYLYGDGSASCAVENSIVSANLPDQIDGPYDDLGGNVIEWFATPPEPVVEPCPEDINGDGVVNLADLGALLALFGQSCP
jgi:hypothetical protein